MNKFNKLYNLILLSIITEDIESKIKKAIQTLIKSGLLKDLNDPRAEQVKTIIKRNNSIDINGQTKLDLLLKQNLEYINRSLAKKSLYLDNIPQFTLKKTYDKGVVIYRVEDSKAGQAAVRKIVDIQWGEDANPWCLIARGHDSWNFWTKYTGYPKHIAFQNGKLLAFCANDERRNKWWDRQDHSHDRLPLLDGTLMEVDVFEYSEEDKKNMMFIKLGVRYNEETKRYDSDGDVKVLEEHIVDGHLPIPFGVINGDFVCHCNDLIVTLNDGNAPTHIKGNCNVGWNDNLKDIGNIINVTEGFVDIHNLPLLKGKLNLSPLWKGQNMIKHYDLIFNKKTGRYDYKKDSSCFFVWDEDLVDGHFPIPIGEVQFAFNCGGCSELTSLLNGPTAVHGAYILRKNPNLRNLKGMALNFSVENSRFSTSCEIELTECENLESLEGMPETFNGLIHIVDCPKLTSLKGLPKNGDYSLSIKGNSVITNLEGCPEKLRTIFILNFENLNSLKGCPEEVNGVFHCTQCPNLTSLQYGPTKVKYSYNCSETGIRNLIGAPKRIESEFDCSRCKSLLSFEGGPEVVMGDFKCVRCSKITSLQYAPKYIGGGLKCSGCTRLKLTDQDYKNYSIGVKRK